MTKNMTPSPDTPVSQQPISPVDPATRSKIQQCLLHWYQAHQRRLPWRDTQDPYHIWVSEVMLQQTQVKTVTPYFLAFLAAFPTLKDLAKADLDRVLKQWEGLGYYARARNLHEAARQVVEVSGGRIPGRFADFKALPGWGLHWLCRDEHRLWQAPGRGGRQCQTGPGPAVLPGHAREPQFRP